MDKSEIAYLVNRDIERGGRELRYRLLYAATSEDTEPEGNEVGFLKDPHANLYPPAWEGERMRPEAKNAIKSHVLNAIELEFQQPDKFIYFTVYGSGASYNWDEAGDFDVQMWVDIDKFNTLHEDDHDLSVDDLVADIRRIVGPINFPSFKDLGLTTDDEDGGAGDMLIQFYPKPGTGSESENLSQKPYACYDMETDEWLVRPKPIRPQFYGDAFLLVEPKAQDVAVQAESALDELQRNVTDFQFWYAMWKKYQNHAYRDRFEDARDKAEQFKDTVKTLFDGVFGGRAEAYGEGGKGIEDERDILQKQLEVWGIFQRLKHFARQPLPWDEQDFPDEPEKESKWRRTGSWADIMENARQLRDNGMVQIQNRMQDPDSGQVHTIGQVGSQSNPGESYETEIWQDDPNSPAITLWTCDCEWGQHSWGRTRQWKKYEGRPCKHALALYWDSLGTPPENADVAVPQQPEQPQMGETPKDWVTAPSTPGGPNIPVQPLDQPQEIQSDMEQQPTPVEQPFSQPQGPPAPDSSTIHFPGALSSWRRQTDHNGWTNWDTWHTNLMIDNIQHVQQAVHNGISTGWTLEQFRDWVLRNVVGPHNADQIKDTQEWNALTPEERREMYPDATIDHDEDDTPSMLMNEGDINWQEIYDHIREEIEGERQYMDNSQSDLTLPDSWGSWRKAGTFASGDIVRCNVDVTGVDRDDVTYKIRRNSAGEVIWSDEENAVVIFPLRANGPLQSHLVRVEGPNSNFYLSPKFKPF